MVALRLVKPVVLALLTALFFWFFPSLQAPAGALDREPSLQATDLEPRS
jgi:hypothetical protein